MSAIYDNWGRLVSSVLRREHDRWLALCDSCSVSSTSSDQDSDPRLSLSFRRRFQSDSNPRLSLSLSHSFDSDDHQSDSDPDRPTTPLLVMNYMGLTLDHRQWKEMVPPGKRKFVWTSAASLSFSIDERSGKNCFLLGATLGCRDIAMVQAFGASEMYTYEPIELPESRFLRSFAFRCPSMFNIRALITMKILSPNTYYATYLVFGLGLKNTLIKNSSEEIHLESIIYVSGRQVQGMISQQGDERPDEWREIRLGKFYVDQHNEGHETIEVTLHEVRMIRTRDIFIEGLEFRPDTPTGKFFKIGR